MLEEIFGLGGRLVVAWASLQTEVSTPGEGLPETGILSMPVEAAGLKPGWLYRGGRGNGRVHRQETAKSNDAGN